MLSDLVLKVRNALRDDRLGRLLLCLPPLSGLWLLRAPHAEAWESAALFDAAYYRNRYPDIGRRQPLAHYLAFGAAEGRSPNPLFDTSYYLERYPDAAASGLNPLVHFLLQDVDERRDPHRLFWSGYYRDRYSDVAEQRWNSLAHYLARGAGEGRFPNPLFDTAYYVRQCPESLWDGANPLDHYVREGAYRHDPHPLFRTAYYLEQYPDVRRQGLNPLVHFLYYGAREGCRPHPLFDTAYYLRRYPDVAKRDGNALIDYLDDGWLAGRFPNALFDTAWYRASYPDVDHEDRNPLIDYAERQTAEGRKPNPLFDTGYYLSRYPEVAHGGREPLEHYLKEGAFTGYNPSPLFDSAHYLAQHPDVLRAGTNPLVHYLYEDGARTSDPHPLFDTSFYRALYLEPGGNAVPLMDYISGGWRDGRRPNPPFDPRYYAEQYPDATGVDPLTDYIDGGAAAGRNPNPLFDTSYYLEHHPELTGSGVNPLAHYMLGGAYHGSDPAAAFDSSYYLEANPDVAAAGLNPLAHYLWIGRDQGRAPGVEAPPDHATAAPRPAADGPLVSVLVPIFNTPPPLLEQAVRSVREQTYRNWQLCLVDDGSTAPETRRALDALAAGDEQIAVRTLPANRGIAAATNAAFELATGELVAMLDHDDELTPDALAEVVGEFRREPETDAVYTDHEVVEEDGSSAWVFIKPDWSPELFRGVMYAGHLLVVRREAMVAAGGFRSEYDGVQDFEFLLRLSEWTRRIRHVRRVLYRWRKAPGSVASGQGHKPDVRRRHLEAVNAHLARLGIKARAVYLERNPDLLRLESTEESATGEYELFWNPDLGPCSADVVRHLALYAAMEDVACVSPVVLRTGGRVHNAGILTGRGLQLRCAYFGWDPAFDGHGGSLACAREVTLVSGDCVLIAKSTLAELAGVRDEYTAGRYRVMDLAMRARISGYRNIVTPSVMVRRAVPPGAISTADHRAFIEEWGGELERPDPYSHAGFDHASHVPLQETFHVDRIEAALAP